VFPRGSFADIQNLTVRMHLVRCSTSLEALLYGDRESDFMIVYAVLPELSGRALHCLVSRHVRLPRSDPIPCWTAGTPTRACAAC
jgi:hypothetical protein